ncbi:MAG: polysaccharide biosynthesis tyrosine autokinase [Verrucomicrobiota bacterium]|jgi:capsular exopolysaccharide synthesis family protein
MDAVTQSEATETKLHFLDYWRVIRLRRSLILVVFLLCLMTSTLLTIWLPKQYSSMVRIQVEKDTPEVPIAEGRQLTIGTDPYFLTTQFKIIESWSILTNVIVSLHLDEKLAQQNGYSRWTLDDTYEYLSHKISVEQTRMTSLIEVSVKNPDAQLAANIVNGIAESYRRSRLDQWKGTRGRGIESLQRMLDETQHSVDLAESNLNQLRVDLNIGEFFDQSPISDTIESESLREWAHDEVTAAADYGQYSNILAKLEAIPREKLGVAIATAYPNHNDPELTEYAYRLAQAKDKMSQAMTDYGEQNPLYQTARKQLDQSQRDYDAKVEGIVNGIRTRVEEDKAYLEIIQRNEDAIKQQRNQSAKQRQPYYSEKAKAENLKRIRDLLQTRLIEEVTEENQPMGSIVVVRDPGRPEKKAVSPKSTVIIPLGIIVGLIVGLGLAFFIEYLDTSVKTIDDVERALQAPVLGVIPQNVGVILEEGTESPHAEAYRVLRTNLLFSRKNESWNTISVLSGGAGEGKSTTLFNLATVFAQNGQRTLVVDSDLRRPTLHKVLHVSNTVGLTDFLLKQRSLDEVIQKTKVPTLDFMASGKLPSSSMSILGSPQMKETIQELKRRYDFIFFDSPPLLGVSDASILASEMDMVLQVIQYRRYPQPMTLRAKQMILKVGGNLIGIVLNNINMSQDENYYYYSGYYEYQSQHKDQTVVQLSEAAKEAKIEIKQKY